MENKQHELIDIVIKTIDDMLEARLEIYLDDYVKGIEVLLENDEKRAMAFVLAKTVLKSYQKELRREEK